MTPFKMNKAHLELMLETFALHANQAYSRCTSHGDGEVAPAPISIPNDDTWMLPAVELQAAGLGKVRSNPNAQEAADFPSVFVLTPRGWLFVAAYLAQAGLRDWAPEGAAALASAVDASDVFADGKVRAAKLLDVISAILK